MAGPITPEAIKQEAFELMLFHKVKKEAVKRLLECYGVWGGLDFGAIIPDKRAAFMKDLCALENVPALLQITYYTKKKKASRGNFDTLNHALSYLATLAIFEEMDTSKPCAVSLDGSTKPFISLRISVNAGNSVNTEILSLDINAAQYSRLVYYSNERK